MKTILLALFTLVVCASVQAGTFPNFHPRRSVLRRIPEQPVTGEQYEARLKSLKKWRSNASSRIVGGQTASPGQFPYQAAVNIDAGYFCGGSIISENYVLTAGHCGVLGNSFHIVVGEINSRDTSSRALYVSTEPHVHEQYDPNSLYADLCLLKLQQSISFTDQINTISLPPMSSNPPSYENTRVIASGWGKTSDNAGGISPTLQYTELTTVTNEECANYYGDIISDSQICAKGDNKQSTCNGDSGGPLAADGPLLIGVISFVSGAGCESGYPSGYTRVTTFRQWLMDNAGV